VFFQFAFADGQVIGQRVAELPHRAEPRVHFLQLGAQQIAHATTFLLAHTGAQKLSDLVERKSEFLRLSDELHAADQLRREETKPALCARRSWQELPPLIKAHSIYAHASARGSSPMRRNVEFIWGFYTLELSRESSGNNGVVSLWQATPQEGEFEPVGSNQTRRVNVRIIAATNRKLEDEIQKGRFRADLFYRLNVLPIQLPPLRQRMEDLPKLVGFFLSRFARKMGRKINGVSQETMERLKSYSWPGNVRELQNVIERAVALTSSAVLTIGSDLAPAAIHAGLPDAQTNGHAGVAPAPLDSLPLVTGASRSLEDVERDHILAVLNQTGWVVEGAKGAAIVLNLNPNTLRSRMKKLGITRSNRHAGPTSM
jgi:hypothetical protein